MKRSFSVLHTAFHIETQYIVETKNALHIRFNDIVRTFTIRNLIEQFQNTFANQTMTIDNLEV